jgi:hypothetical protein
MSWGGLGRITWDWWRTDNLSLGRRPQAIHLMLIRALTSSLAVTLTPENHAWEEVACPSPRLPQHPAHSLLGSGWPGFPGYSWKKQNSYSNDHCTLDR